MLICEYTHAVTSVVAVFFYPPCAQDTCALTAGFHDSEQAAEQGKRWTDLGVPADHLVLPT